MAKVFKGYYKGAVGTITRRNKSSVTLTLSKPLTIPNEDEDGWDDDDEYYAGDTITVPKLEVAADDKEADLMITNEKIRELALSLRGELLKKKMLENPLDGEAEIKRLLDCVEVE